MSVSQIVTALEPYYDDPVAFAHDVVGFEPTAQQSEFMMAVANNKRVSVKSGHGIGKTRAEATLAWWFLMTRPKSIIPATAPTSHQLFDILWKELMWVREQLPRAFSDSFDVSSQRIWHKAHKNQWFLQARTARRDKPEALQGFHGEHLLILVEEAGGVDSEIFETIEGALTEKDNHILLVGNPTRTMGYFYDSHNLHRDQWVNLTYSSLDSPLYDHEQAESLKQRYSERSNVYQIRVLGNFPGTEPDQLISIQDLEKAVMLDTLVKAPIVWALDVARMGDDESVLCKRHGMRILPLKGWHGLDLEQLARAVMGEFNRTPKDLKPTKIVIDANGIGAGVYDRLVHKGYPVVDFMAQWKPSDPLRWANIKAELYDETASRIKLGKLCLPDFDADGNRENELIAQGASIRYEIDERTGFMRIVGKQTMKDKYGVPSPDRFESVVMSFFDEEADCGREDDDDPFAQDMDPIDGYEYEEFVEVA